MTFDPSQLISRKSSALSVVSNANGTPSMWTSSQKRRLVVVLGGANSTTWIGHRIVRSRLVKLSQPMELVLRGRETKFASSVIRVNWLRAIVSRSH
ncbi:unnamed protein product [Prunus brigantina]